MCQYLPSTSMKLIKNNKSFQVLITCLHKFKLYTSLKILFLLKLTLRKGPGFSNGLIGVPRVEGS